MEGLNGYCDKRRMENKRTGEQENRRTGTQENRNTVRALDE